MNYLLMHKDSPVAGLVFDNDGNVNSISEKYDKSLMPLSAQRDKYNLKQWLKDRAIPKTRDGLSHLLATNNVRSSEVFLLDNLGLSLNDCYWLKPFNSELTWGDVNLFENDFAPSEYLSEMNTDSLNQRLNLSPNSSLQGELKKKWFINETGKRIMVKGNYGENCQQSLNEEFATLVNTMQGSHFPFVSYTVRPYSFEDVSQAFCCFSKNFITSDKEEFIPAWEVFNYTRYEKHKGTYNQFLENCESLGLDSKEVASFLSYQILLDYIISNTDRHLNNFGVIRDTETLKLIRMCPIYDCGNSMFWDQRTLKANPKELDKLETCSFNKKERELLRYVDDFNSFDISKLPDDNAIYNIYSKDKNISDEKIEQMIKCLKYKKSVIEKRQG